MENFCGFNYERISCWSVSVGLLRAEPKFIFERVTVGGYCSLSGSLEWCLSYEFAVRLGGVTSFRFRLYGYPPVWMLTCCSKVLFYWV